MDNQNKVNQHVDSPKRSIWSGKRSVSLEPDVRQQNLKRKTLNVVGRLVSLVQQTLLKDGSSAKNGQQQISSTY
jgi:hypothetical protein